MSKNTNYQFILNDLQLHDSLDLKNIEEVLIEASAKNEQIADFSDNGEGLYKEVKTLKQAIDVFNMLDFNLTDINGNQIIIKED